MKTLLPIVAVSFSSTTGIGIVFADDKKNKQQELVEKPQKMKKDAKEQVQGSNQTMQQLSRTRKIIGTFVQGANDDNHGVTI